jgi:hypothetical protein
MLTVLLMQQHTTGAVYTTAPCRGPQPAAAAPRCSNTAAARCRGAQQRGQPSYAATDTAAQRRYR